MTTHPSSKPSLLASPVEALRSRAVQAQRSRAVQALMPAAVAALMMMMSARPCAASCSFISTFQVDVQCTIEASKVVLVRDGDRTVLTMTNDYTGDPAQFALFVPVPVVLRRDQIRVVDPEIIDRIEDYTRPLLLETRDWWNPCGGTGGGGSSDPGDAVGVTVEATYAVGEYEIVILSADDSAGLETWLDANGYVRPAGMSAALAPYIAQGFRFFVARVNLTEHASSGATYLRPIQMDFTSPRYMLPIRLGMLNAAGPQELVVFAFSKQGRVELANYRTEEVISSVTLPPTMAGYFTRFYRDMFRLASERAGGDVAFTEYACSTEWCGDEDIEDPLTAAELLQLGVWWKATGSPGYRDPVFLTRLHLRYDADRWPEDLVLRETADWSEFQARYFMRQPYRGPMDCPAGEAYTQELQARLESEAARLAELTGWSLQECRTIAGLERAVIDDSPVVLPPRQPAPALRQPWWRRMFR